MRQRETRVAVLLRARDGLTPELIANAAAAISQRSQAVPENVGIRFAVRTSTVNLASSHLERLMPSSPPLDVCIDVWQLGDTPPAIIALRDAVDAVRSLTCPYRSQVLAGPQVRFIRGYGALSLDFLLARKQGMSHDEMIEYWQNKHTALKYPRLSGYSQLHMDPALTATTADYLSLPAGVVDGLTEPHYDDPDHFYRTSFDRSVYQSAARDELNFLDHTGCSFAVMSNVWLSVPTLEDGPLAATIA